MPIVWREQMNVGIKAIDDDHRKLVELINTFEELVRRSPKLDLDQEALVRTVLARLQTYAREHFAREERLQVVAGYAGLDENKREHQNLSRDLGNMIDRYHSSVGEPLTGEEMLKFLNSWLVNHIIRIDLKMRGRMAG